MLGSFTPPTTISKLQVIKCQAMLFYTWSLMMIPGGPKHTGVLRVTTQYI